MPIPVKYLNVRSNPWIVGCIDHLGRPAGRVHVDPHEHSPVPATFVGCRFAEVKEIEAAKTMKLGKREIETAPARHDHRIAYSKENVSIPNSGYYRDAIKRGDLLPADEKTARHCGIAKFVKPEEALEKCRTEAIKNFNDSTGEDAHAEMGASEPLWLLTAEEQKSADDKAADAAKSVASSAAVTPPIAPPKPADPKGAL